MKTFKNFMAERCWDGYTSKGLKKKGNKMVPDCVPVSESNNAAIAIAKKKSGNYDKDGFRKTPYKNPNSPLVKSNTERKKEMNEVAAWQRKEGKNPEGGLNHKGIESYRRENPGSKLSMAVTTKPSKLKAGSKSANRRKSFCARMGGMKKRLTSAETARDPDSRINKALRKWNC